MSSRALHCLLIAALLLGPPLISHAGMSANTSYTDRGKTDFDTALQVLNPYGTWAKIGRLWAYTPLDHQAPYTNGRWIYTEYGWYWKGHAPHSWATEHYGYWKRSANKVWSWYPGPFWLPQTVEMRATTTHIGWRSAAVDDDGNFIEKPEARYVKTDEWTFVSLAQFANPITPAAIVLPDVAKELLEDSTECNHTYLTYREIDRPGPHPADFLALCQDGGMFAPKTFRDRMASQPPPPSAVLPGLTPNLPLAKSPAATTNAPAGGTNAPTASDAPADPAVDTRKVKYWITMSLPSYSAQPPPDANPEEIYLYRPDFYQDNDGIERRITLWFNPKARTTLQEALAANTPAAKPTDSGRPGASAKPAKQAVPVSADEAPPSDNPFHSPLDDSYHESGPPHSASTKNSASPAPSGANDTPIPLPITNAPPTNPHL